MKFSIKLKTLVTFVVLELILIFNILFVVTNWKNLTDYGSFISSGRLANMGRNPYSTDYPLVFYVKFGENGPSGYAPNLNPPITVLFFRLIADVNAHSSIAIWRTISFIIVFFTFLYLNKQNPIAKTKGFMRFLWALCLAGLWHTIELGQIYAFLFFLTTFSWVFAKNGKKEIAGILLGIAIALKPNLLIWAFLLFITRNWKIIAYGFLSGFTLSIIPVFSNGFQIYQQWLECISEYGDSLLGFPANNSFQGFTVRIGNAQLGIFLGLLFLTFVVFIIVKYHPNLDLLNGIGISASLLISPIAWSGYTLLLVPIFFMRKHWDPILKFAAAILIVPVIIIIRNFNINLFSNIVLGWFYGWGILLIVLWLFNASSRKSDNVKLEST